MLRLIYLFNNLHLNKISISFIIVSTIVIMFSVNSCITIDLNNLEDLRNYQTLKDIFIIDIYNFLELIIAMFVIILSFMELYNNSHLFDVVLIAQHQKTKVLLAKIISYLAVVVVYISIIFLFISLIAVSSFQDIYILDDIFTLYLYCVFIGVITLVLSLILINLFRNYFANFLLLIVVIIKRIFLETNNEFINKIIPYIDTKDIAINLNVTMILLYLITTIVICFIIYKFKDIKT